MKPLADGDAATRDGVPGELAPGMRAAVPRGGTVSDGSRRSNAAARILDAAVRELAEHGAAGLSLQSVADRAGVSKGLVSYHYHDRSALLTRVAASIAERVAIRESHALDAATPVTAVDGLWVWLTDELERGELRALLALGHDAEPAVRGAAAAAAAQRRSDSARTVTRLFSLIGLAPRVPAEMLGGTVAAFIDGVALGAAPRPADDPRAWFDVFWLAVLGLAE